MKDENLYEEDDIIDEEKVNEKPKKDEKDSPNRQAEVDNSHKKEVYSLNLTEGRVVFIFATFIIIVFAGIFSTIFIMSHMSKKKITVTSNSKPAAKSSESEDNQAMEFNFYSELVKKSDGDTKKEDFSKNTKKSTESDINKVAIDSVKTTENNIVKNENGTTPTNISENVVSEEIVVLDDSEIIYSSKNSSDSDNVNITETVEAKKSESVANAKPVTETKKDIFVNKETNSPIKSESVKTNSASSVTAAKRETAAPTKAVVSNNSAPKVAKSSQPQAKDTTRYVVQIGSFTNESKAKELEKFYQASGYPTYIKVANIDGKDYYRLRVGPFRDKSRANDYLNLIKNSKYGKDSYLSKVAML